MTNLRQPFSEFLGTFIMVFAGTSAIVINDLHAGVITHMGISLVFGLVVAAVIYTLGNISGAYICDVNEAQFSLRSNKRLAGFT